jgi:hypothetical protein
VSTPELQRLAEGGIHLRHAISMAPTFSHSTAGLFTPCPL